MAKKKQGESQEKTENKKEESHGYSQTEIEQQEKMLKINLLEQEAKQIEQQLALVEQQVIELQLLQLHLDEVEKVKTGNEILASIGKNIFLKAELKSLDVLVDVGAKTVIKKTPQEVKELIEKDIAKLIDIRNKIAQELEKVALEMSRV